MGAAKVDSHAERAFIQAFNEWYSRDGSVGGLEQLTEDHDEVLKKYIVVDVSGD